MLGREESIRRVASARSALWVGLVLVLTAGIAREYDQTYIPYFGIRFLLPVITSFIAAAFIYGVVFGLLIPRPFLKGSEAAKEPNGGFLCFLGLFWLTAPLAWVYAFPAEHLFDSYTAAQINIGLLVFVATARVLIICRAISVLCQVPFYRCVVSVLYVSSFVMALGSITTSLSLVQVMGGLRHSPEELVLGGAAAAAFILSLVGFIVLTFAHHIIKEKSTRTANLPVRSSPGAPLLFLCIAVLVWVAILIPQQKTLALNHQALVLFRNKDYKGMIQFLSSHAPDDFNKVTRLPPDPYEYWGLRKIPNVIRALDGTEAPWVREMYLDYFGISLSHYWIYENIPIAAQLDHVLSLPGGEEWVRRNAKIIEEHFKRYTPRRETPDLGPLADKLRALGLKIEKPPQSELKP